MLLLLQQVQLVCRHVSTRHVALIYAYADILVLPLCSSGLAFWLLRVVLGVGDFFLGGLGVLAFGQDVVDCVIVDAVVVQDLILGGVGLLVGDLLGLHSESVLLRICVLRLLVLESDVSLTNLWVSLSRLVNNGFLLSNIWATNEADVLLRALGNTSSDFDRTLIRSEEVFLAWYDFLKFVKPLCFIDLKLIHTVCHIQQPHPAGSSVNCFLPSLDSQTWIQVFMLEFLDNVAIFIFRLLLKLAMKTIVLFLQTDTNILNRYYLDSPHLVQEYYLL